MPDSEAIVRSIKEEYGSKLAILGHHYQSDDIIAQCDITGDSLELSRKIEGLEANHIVFCGVFFMAESAAILRRADQNIHIPDLGASCPMADMAEAEKVAATLDILERSGRKIIPLTYVNSSAAVKAVVGARGGSVCTSANAKTMLQWAMDQGDSVLFLPDKHLARNTANALDIPESERFVLNADVIDGEPALCVTPEQAEHELIIWPGYCPIHDDFEMQRLEDIRKDDPEALIVVHPECSPQVTGAADANGSTSFIIKYVAEMAEKRPGATIHVATEANLVLRLAQKYEGRLTIVPFQEERCEDMGKITMDKLAVTLGNLKTAAPVEVDEKIAVPARLALERMLKACA